MILYIRGCSSLTHYSLTKFLSPQQFTDRVATGNLTVVDVRELNEKAGGIVKGAVDFVSLESLTAIKSDSHAVVFICMHGESESQDLARQLACKIKPLDISEKPIIYILQGGMHDLVSHWLRDDSSQNRVGDYLDGFDSSCWSVVQIGDASTNQEVFHQSASEFLGPSDRVYIYVHIFIYLDVDSELLQEHISRLSPSNGND